VAGVASRVEACSPAPMPHRAALLAAACAALLLAACHPPRTPPPDLSLDPAALLAQVRAAQGVARTVQGEARVHFRSPRGSASVKQLTAVEAPDRIRLEELDFFGNPAAVLVASGGRFALWDVREKVLYRGAATPENLSRLVPVPFTAPELATLLLGSAPLLDGPAVRAAPERAQVRLRLEQGGAVQELWIGARAAVEKAARKVAGGAGPGSWEVEFSGHQERGGAWFPGALALRSAPSKVEVELSWSDVEVNGPLDPRLFELQAPRGARVVELAEGAP
jgi:hypothetical protein